MALHLAALRALPRAQTPVIFMTAKVQKREIAQYLALGAAGHPQPFDPMTLAETYGSFGLRPPNR
jgi:CheY-like chemotaxis protein